MRNVETRVAAEEPLRQRLEHGHGKRHSRAAGEEDDGVVPAKVAIGLGRATIRAVEQDRRRCVGRLGETEEPRAEAFLGVDPEDKVKVALLGRRLQDLVDRVGVGNVRNGIGVRSEGRGRWSDSETTNNER